MFALCQSPLGSLREGPEKVTPNMVSCHVFGAWWNMIFPGTLNNHILMDVWRFPTIFYVKIWNHPTETTNNKQMGV